MSSDARSSGDPATSTFGAIFGAEKMLFWSTFVSALDFGAAIVAATYFTKIHLSLLLKLKL